MAALSDVRLDRYRPLARLMSVEDVTFLQEELSASPDLVKRLMNGRRRIAIEYLKALEGDFNCLYAAASDMVIFAPPSEADLASRLAQIRLSFQFNLFLMRAGLWMPVGVKLEVAKLIGAMQTLQGEVSRLNDLAIERQLA